MTKASDEALIREGIGRESSQRREIIRRVADLLKPSRDQRLIYHYTSPAAFLPITQNGSLWATHVRFLNDKREFSYAIDRVQEKLRASIEAGSGASRALFERLLSIADEAHGVSAYVVSFSTEGDTLSQWRAYCPAGGGYAIGMEAIRVIDAAAQQRFVVVKCLYKLSAQDEVLDQLLDSVSAYLLDARDRNAYPGHSLESVEAAVFGQLLSVVSPALKHPSFREELEWRVVWLPWMDTDFTDVRFRAGKYTLIPYREFSIRDVGGDLPIMDLVIGPTPYPERSEEALREYLPRVKVPPAVIRMSQTPFREW